MLLIYKVSFRAYACREMITSTKFMLYTQSIPSTWISFFVRKYHTFIYISTEICSFWLREKIDP
jgi:hypothetical protein